jgi:hypothetical protein
MLVQPADWYPAVTHALGDDAMRTALAFTQLQRTLRAHHHQHVLNQTRGHTLDGQVLRASQPQHFVDFVA